MNQLGLNFTVEKVAKQLADNMTTSGILAGRSPLSSAAACIYMASHLLKEGKSAKEISAVAGVSDGTIRTAYKTLYGDRETLIDAEILREPRVDMNNLPTS